MTPFMELPHALGEDLLNQARQQLADVEFLDGKLSAGQWARRVKHNREASADNVDIAGLGQTIVQSLSRLPLFRAAALPKRFSEVIFARYQPGMAYGATDDFSYNVAENPVHVRDLHATILHLLGIDHQRFSFRFQGLDQKLTGVKETRVVREILG